MKTHRLPQAGQFSIAGVVVRSRQADVSQVAECLAGLLGVDVHHVEASTGRLVITVETDGPDDEEARLERVRREPGVLSAELVYHYVEPPVAATGTSADAGQGGL